MPEPKGNLVTPIGETAGGVLKSFLVDEEGRLVVTVLPSTTAKARAYLSTAQDVLDDTDTTIAIDAVTFDPSGIVDLANHKVVIKVKGVYSVIGGEVYQGGDVVADKRLIVGIRKNGALYSQSWTHSSITGMDVGGFITDVIPCDIGDELLLCVLHHFGAPAALYFASHLTFFAVHLLSAD